MGSTLIPLSKKDQLNNAIAIRIILNRISHKRVEKGFWDNPIARASINLSKLPEKERNALNAFKENINQQDNNNLGGYLKDPETGKNLLAYIFFNPKITALKYLEVSLILDSLENSPFIEWSATAKLNIFRLIDEKYSAIITQLENELADQSE